MYIYIYVEWRVEIDWKVFEAHPHEQVWRAIIRGVQWAKNQMRETKYNSMCVDEQKKVKGFGVLEISHNNTLNCNI